MSDKEEVNITVTTNQLSSSKVSQYQRGLNRFIKIYRKLELSVTFDSIWKLQKKKSISTQKLKSANMNRNMFNYILKRKQLQLSELRSKSPFRGGNKSRYGDELHSRAGKRAYMKSRGKSRKFRKWGKGDKQGQSEGWGQGEAGGRFRNKSANNGGNGGTNDQQGRSMTGGGGMYRNKSSKIQNRREDGGGMNNISGEENGGGMNNISGEGRSERKFNNSGQNEGAGNYGNNNMNSNNKGGQYNNVNQNNKGGQNNNDNNQNLNQDQQNKNLNLGERYSDYPQNNENGFYYDKNGNKQIGNQYNSEGQQNFGNGKNRFKKNKGDDNFNQGTGYDNFRNNINKLNNRDNNENNNDYISFTKNESEYYRKEPLSHWIWEKRKKELQRKFPNLNNDEILKMLKREFGLKLLRNVFHNKNQKNKSHIFNRLTRFLGKNKRDKITFMYLESVLRNMKNKNLRSLFSKFRTKNSKTKTNKTIKIEKKVVRTISKKIKETQPDKYIILLLDSIRKDKLRKAFQNIRLTSLFKKLKSQPGGMYTIEHIQEVKRGILDGQDLNYKLMAVILDKIMAFNQRRHKHLAINEMKDLDLDSTKVLYPRVSKIKNNKSISGKHHPMFK